MSDSEEEHPQIEIHAKTTTSKYTVQVKQNANIGAVGWLYKCFK